MSSSSHLSERVTLVTIESPYFGDIERNVEYLLECMHDSYMHRKEAPIASHLLYTRLPQKMLRGGDGVYQGHVKDIALDALNVNMGTTARHGRMHGIRCGFAWNKHAEICAVYTDHGISKGMEYGIEQAKQNGTKIEYRKIYNI
jgi:hypothetical protein